MNDRIIKNFLLTKLDFRKFLKIHEIFFKVRDVLFCLTMFFLRENMFTIEIEDGREAP